MVALARSLAVIAIVLILSIWSTATIIVDIWAKPYLLLAERLEGRPVHTPLAIETMHQAIRARTALASCHREIVRGTVSIELAALVATLRGQDAIASVAELNRAERALKDGLRCFPQDGNLWLRLAMVEFTRSGDNVGIEQMLMLSASTSPSEAWIMKPRMALAAQLADLGLDGIGAVLRADVERFVLHAQPSDFADLYVQAGEPLRGMLHAGLAGLDGERRWVLQQYVDAATAAQAAQQ